MVLDCLLKFSYGSSYNDLFDIVEDIRSNVPFMGISTILLTSILESTSNRSTSTDTITSLVKSFEGNGTS